MTRGRALLLRRDTKGAIAAVPLTVHWSRSAARTIVAEVHSELEERGLEIVLPSSVSFGLPLIITVSIGLRGALVIDLADVMQVPAKQMATCRNGTHVV